jgi:hypothetical protein
VFDNAAVIGNQIVIVEKADDTVTLQNPSTLIADTPAGANDALHPGHSAALIDNLPAGGRAITCNTPSTVPPPRAITATASARPRQSRPVPAMAEPPRTAGTCARLRQPPDEILI